VNKFKGLVLLAILVSAAGSSPIFASPATSPSYAGVNSTTGMPLAPSITGAIAVTTDKPSYNDGDKITISGTSRDYISDTPVTVMIRNPIGNIIKIDQVELGTDKTYSTTVTASGSLWQAAGTYQVMVQLGSKDRSAETSFQFTGSAAGTGVGNTIKVVGTDFSVTYSITNGKVLGIKADTLSKSLIVSIQTTGDGVLTITLPRGLIDAKVSGTDAKYIVLNDNEESDFQEINTTTMDRTLSIPFTDGTTQIEIVGTFVIPEFGTIAALVLVVAIVSMIAISSRTRLKSIPKY
jgi:predicted secreted protein with PEFG-CTERM motif